jgi:hypothetical protein
MSASEASEIARMVPALERIVADAEEHGDIAGVNGMADLARRALAGEDIRRSSAMRDRTNLVSAWPVAVRRTSWPASSSPKTASGNTPWTCPW